MHSTKSKQSDWVGWLGVGLETMTKKKNVWGKGKTTQFQNSHDISAAKTFIRHQSQFESMVRKQTNNATSSVFSS